MRVLHVIQRYAPAVGGAEIHAGEICRRLARSGHDVTVVTTEALDFEYFWEPRARILSGPNEERIDGVRVLRFPVRHLPLSPTSYFGWRRGLRLLSASRVFPTEGLARLCRLTPWVPALRRWLETTDERFDVVGGMTICFESLLLDGQDHARAHGTPFVAFPLTHLGVGDPRRDRVGRFYTMRHQLRLVARADAVVAQTGCERAFYAGLGVARDRIVIGGPGVQPEALVGGDAARFRARYGIDEPIVFFIGAMSPDKGVPQTIEAMRRLWANGRQARLVLAGAVVAPMRKHLATLPEDVRRRMLVLDHVDEQTKLDLLAAGDVFAMPSRTDSFGIVYLEAWVYGKPVIGAAAGGVQDVIADGQDGLLVQFGDVPALAAAIDRLLTQPDLARAMGQAGREKTLREHTWERKAGLVEDLYVELAERAGAAAARRSPVSA